MAWDFKAFCHREDMKDAAIKNGDFIEETFWETEIYTDWGRAVVEDAILDVALRNGGTIIVRWDDFGDHYMRLAFRSEAAHESFKMALKDNEALLKREININTKLCSKTRKRFHDKRHTMHAHGWDWGEWWRV